jgi:hypothetical protein
MTATDVTKPAPATHGRTIEGRLAERLSDPSQTAKDVAEWCKKYTLGVTIGLFAFLALKTLVMAKGDVPTALAILQSAPLTLVVVGALLSAFPLVVLVFNAWVSFYIVTHPKELGGYAAFIVVLLISAVVSPWSAYISGPIIGGLLYLACLAGSRNSKLKRVVLRWSARLVLLLVALHSIYVVMYAVWLPHEAVFSKGNPNPTVGYVLDTGGGWTTVLVSGHRRIVLIPSDDVESRTVCVLNSSDSGVIPLPHQSDTLWRLLGRVSSSLAPERPPDCSDVSAPNP